MEKRLDLIRSGARYLDKQGVVNSSGEAERFLAHILNCSRLELYLENKEIAQDKSETFWGLLNCRAQGMPLQYMLGNIEFMGLEFKVAPGVFIPRPETEILVETAIAVLTRQAANPPTRQPTILDIGTGCGNIAISLAKYLEQACLTARQANIFACDISHSALQLTRENACLNGVSVSLTNSDLFTAFQRNHFFSLIISNPPYISEKDFADLPRELQYEPLLAYNGGPDGLIFYRRIINQAADYLTPGGLLALEMGDGQSGCIQGLFAKSGEFDVVNLTRDYNEKERVIIARRN